VTAARDNVYIVRISISVAELRDRLQAVDGALFVRELPPARVVVALPSRAAAQHLAALDGVTSVIPDRLQRPHTRLARGQASAGSLWS
jgi:hypothetical protein